MTFHPILLCLLLLGNLFVSRAFSVPPSDDVSDSTLLGVQDTLLIFVAHIGLHLVSVLVEGHRLDSNRIVQISRKAQVNKLRALLLILFANGPCAKLGKYVSRNQTTCLNGLFLVKLHFYVP